MSEDKTLLHKTYSLATALLTGEDVPEEQMRKRLEICNDCSKAIKSEGVMKCGVCGCKLKDQGLINLTRYKETDDYGCFFHGTRVPYPQRSKWADHGV